MSKRKAEGELNNRRKIAKITDDEEEQDILSEDKTNYEFRCDTCKIALPYGTKYDFSIPVSHFHSCISDPL